LTAAAARTGDVDPQPFPWDAVLHLGLGQLRLTPCIFWSLSLRELMATGGALRPRDGIDRTALSALMARWPDWPAADQPR
jgi:uncharacterized phage protein (TIGR02216 family)